jgi:hypothetical protein
MLIERRSHTRSNLHVPLFLFPAGSTEPVRTETENIAIDGFFCFCSHPFSPGDHITFLLLLPNAGNSAKTSKVYLCGEVEVVRISIRAIPNGYGVGCRIASYGVLPDCDSLDLDQALAAVIETGCISLS